MISEIVSPKRSEADRWVSVPERGTPVSLGVIAWIAERVGRRLARLLLYPITVYFLITAHAARRASYEFLKRARRAFSPLVARIPSFLLFRCYDSGPCLFITR